ncbi:MAG: hypothetical protein GX275_14875 [Clostridiales bacterium]|nr:hypothetical protein [Clostridiales bacterium]
MAFVNAYLTEEEMRKLIAANIPHPLNKRWKMGENIRRWTVDKENKIYLFHCGVIDREDYNNEMFALILGNMDAEHFVTIHLYREHSKDKSEELKAKYNNEDIVVWKFIDMNIPEKLEQYFTQKDILVSLNEALDVYAIDGGVDQNFTVKAIIEI